MINLILGIHALYFLPYLSIILNLLFNIAFILMSLIELVIKIHSSSVHIRVLIPILGS